MMLEKGLCSVILAAPCARTRHGERSVGMLALFGSRTHRESVHKVERHHCPLVVAAVVSTTMEVA